jgi:hypothetical protein
MHNDRSAKLDNITSREDAVQIGDVGGNLIQSKVAKNWPRPYIW